MYTVAEERLTPENGTWRTVASHGPYTTRTEAERAALNLYRYQPLGNLPRRYRVSSPADTQDAMQQDLFPPDSDPAEPTLAGGLFE